MNYHFFIDEKFVNDFISDAEQVDPEQLFIVLSGSPLKFVTHPKAIHLNYGYDDLKTITSKINEKDKLFVHWFTPRILEIIDNIPTETKVYLMFWGGDFLESNFPTGKQSKLNDFLYDVLTFQYVRESVRNSSFNQITNRLKAAKESGNFKNIAHTRIQNFKLKRQLNNGQLYLEEKKIRTRFLQRIEAICHWNHFDVSVIEKFYGVKLRQLYFVYSSGLSEIKSKKQIDVTNTLNIWLGNSDTPTNNHLDALSHLKHLKQEKIKIICPLNYGNKDYGDLVEKAGKQIFGDKFHAIRDYVDRNAYYNLMNETDIALMFHNRGQAGGNIIAFLKKGIKVYLKDQSSISKLFMEIGIQIYSANEISSLSFNELKAPVVKDEVERNIQLIHSTIGNEEKRKKALENLLKGYDNY